ncbi:AraC family transcriptional regulator [Pedobacter frigiditerrae]|uniref:AraC family transcriptional regulator n=1 Tax=Pedobacter frigiditerrae TaxID=2530452 RepID=A0A4R0MPS4_9SPHI|nr:AraC family transcriptional regulator [Pedobacter frigiditerrae]TCC88242.1 AraC family transcriptional regulator [Pedobacter frigiditerrae]
MIGDHERYDLFGKTLLEVLVLKPPFNYEMPAAENACFHYMLENEMQYKIDEKEVSIASNESVLLNCRTVGNKMSSINTATKNKLVIVHFHPDILKKIYDREMPTLLQKPKNAISNKTSERINNDFLIHKYIEGLLFYFENPSLVNEDILILKLKEIIILLSQTKNAEAIQMILSQLFSPTIYSFKQIIAANLFSAITLDELADYCNLSLSSFKREFAKHYNDTPANYIKTKRLEKATELLTISDKRITDIAFECGFNDLANFTKSFHDKYSITPSNYRLNQIAK